ncbi:hypothetical protein [Luteolibacter sp. Populi]|uniref:hypothetical protein n=1 Tax=Luteolibacter sp. Populi TaxID=3230487 RepID=UPI003467E546
MAPNKTASAIPAHAQEESTATRWTSLKWVAIAVAVACIPFAIWLLGSGIAWVTPATYHSGVLLRVEPGNAALHELKSEGVMGPAATALAGGDADPMAAYLLWSSITVAQGPAANLIKVEARSARAEEARRTVLAVAEAYRTHRSRAADGSPLPALIYVDPVEVAPLRVPDETRMMLGIAGLASICLLLCVPFLRRLEQAMPLRPLGIRAVA